MREILLVISNSARSRMAIDPPVRLAHMRASVMGSIPFTGKDKYKDGQGYMFGKVAGMITVFDDRDAEIAQSALLTIFAGALFFPSFVISDQITRIASDDSSATARMQAGGMDLTGTFSLMRKDC
ncbi:MAG: hypothetical protein FJ042_00210 [Candidatus Cloacimonetes bacterium]|nr:hypothetical protein [Candidatus Cloacimonadota bacterium]